MGTATMKQTEESDTRIITKEYQFSLKSDMRYIIKTTSCIVSLLLVCHVHATFKIEDNFRTENKTTRFYATDNYSLRINPPDK